ncbi:TPA: hypothetical protein ACHS0B_005059, partial [Escherichia coli]
GYQKPQQTHDVQPVKQPRCSQSDTSSLIRLPMRSKLTPPQLVRSRIPEATADSLCAAGEYNPVVRSRIPEATADS